MKKYFLLLGCSLIAAGAVISASASSANDGLKAVKDMYVKEFQAMDTDKNGQVSQQEFLTYQFNTLRANVIEAEGFGDNEDVAETSAQNKPVAEVTTETTSESIVGVPSALNAMANYELDEDDILKEEPARLTKEDVMPEGSTQEPVEELDLSISEEESLRQLIDGVENKSAAEGGAEVVAEVTEESETIELPESKESQIQFMLDTIKRTLPKKIDEITTWVDIKYADNVIDYIYKADIDTSSYSAEEIKVLKDNIQNEACVRAYSEMCPRIKPMFIDKGTDMRIIYLDKADKDISSCEFNKTTCNE